MRVLVNGAWGFACDRRLSAGGAGAAAGKACAFAKAAPGGHTRELRRSSRQRVFSVHRSNATHSRSRCDKIELCLRAEGALAHEDVKVTSASVRAQREHKVFVSSEGAVTEHELVECGGGIDALAARDGVAPDPQLPERPRRLELPGRLGVRRVARPRARGSTRGRTGGRAPAGAPCPSQVTTVVIDAEQTALQVHESVGHPTELDRVYGTEAAYAGTSFLKPEDLGSLVRLRAHERDRRLDHSRRPRHLRLRRRGRPGRAAADRRRRGAERVPHFARDRSHDRERVGRLDARGHLELHAARAHDEPPPRARRGLPRRVDRRR